MKTEDNRKRVGLVDDDVQVLASLEAGLAGHFDIVARCTSGEEALKLMTTMPVERRPDLVLLDIKLPGLDGIACCRELRRLFHRLLIAMHTAKPVRELIEEAHRAGADAYIAKGSVTMAELVSTLQQLNRHEKQCLCVAGDSPAQPAETSRARLLTPRESRVVEMLSQGLTQKEVAAGLGCSLRNVQKLVEKAKVRLSARSREQLIRSWLVPKRGS